MKKILSITILLIIILFTLSGCYDTRGVEELAYVTALGLDISENNLLLLTFQISLPSSASSPDSGSSQSNNTDTITVECNSINSGLSLANSYISKEIDLTQCKVIIISEKLAERGISEYIDTLSNNIEIRPDSKVIISRCTAKNFIKNASPTIESLTARFYEVTLKSNEYTGYTTSTEFVDLVENIRNPTIQANAILGGVNFKNKAKRNSNNSNISDSSYKAEELPVEDSDTIEIFGTAVFNNDKLVGELTGIETICHLIITNKLKSCDISVPNPLTENSNIDLKINPKRNSKINVDFINGTPFISIEVFLEGYGRTLNSDIDYSSAEDLKKINKSAEQYLKIQLENYLYKTSKEFNSDIAGFGKKAVPKYLTIDDWLSSKWLENYKNSFFAVKVNMNIKSGSAFNKSP